VASKVRTVVRAQALTPFFSPVFGSCANAPAPLPPVMEATVSAAPRTWPPAPPLGCPVFPPPLPPPGWFAQVLPADVPSPLFLMLMDTQVSLELLAFPLVALPPVVLFETLALPVLAFWVAELLILTLLLFVTVELLRSCIEIGLFGPCVEALPLPPPLGIELILFITRSTDVELELLAFPLVALPPVVLFETVAFPLEAV
jgi:hypothetical protein